jgi:hypothetical protein
MKHSLKTFLIILFMVAFSGWLLAQGNFSTSLHATRAGKPYWYSANSAAPVPGFETLTNVPIEQLGCVECHGPTDADGNAYTGTYSPNCIDCHPSNSSFNPDSIKVDQCLGCHGRQKAEMNPPLSYTDVHRDSGMVCWDCHTSNDMHGTATQYNSMLEPGAIEVDCEDCHTTAGGTLPDHSSWNPAAHNDNIHCTACHAQTVISCYNCHFESQVQAHVKRAKQKIHDFVVLVNRTKDGKVYPATFQSLSYQGNTWAAFGPFTSHSITGQGRTCSDCHYNMGGQNAAIAEYNSTGEMHFAKWNSADSTLSWIHGVVPFPEDYQTSFKMDFITYNGDPSDPPGPSKNWSYIGKSTWDGHQLFFATPLTAAQHGKLGMNPPVGIEPEPGSEVVESYVLAQNYPNPFNPTTTIEFRVPRQTTVTLKIYNLLGSEVNTLIQGENLTAGTYKIPFDASDLTSGVYLYQLITADFSTAKKMILMK